MADSDLSHAVTAFRAFNRVHTRFAGVLTPRYMGSELGVLEARLLYEIARQDEVLATALQERLDLDAGYASRVLARFEERGWIRRDKRGRERPIALTEAGREAFEALDATTREETARQLETLAPADRTAFVTAIDRARTILEGTPDSWILRPFRTGDMGLIASAQSIFYARAYGWERVMEALIGEITVNFLRDFKEGREQCWVAERDGTMLGTVFLVDDGDGWARLRLLYVDGAARGLGIGEALVRACVTFARQAGYRGVRLWTHTVLTSARRIYAAQGFRIVETHTHDDFGKPEQSETWELDFARPVIAQTDSPADIAAVAKLFRGYAASLPVDLGYQDFAAELAGLPGSYAPPAGALLLARDVDGTPLGCVALRPREDGVCEMKRLYVLPEARGSGLGRALAEAVIGQARRRGYRELRLDTLPSMTGAIALYEAMGFVRIAHYYAPTPEGTVFLALSLSDGPAATPAG